MDQNVESVQNKLKEQLLYSDADRPDAAKLEEVHALRTKYEPVVDESSWS